MWVGEAGDKLNQANKFENSGRYVDAKKLYIELCDPNKRKLVDYIPLLLQISSVCAKLKQFEESLYYAKKGYNTLNEFENLPSKLVIDSIYCLSTAYGRNGDYEYAIKYAKQLIEKYELDEYKKADLLENLSIYNYYIFNYNEALYYANETIKMKPSNDIFYTRELKADILFKLDHNQEALDLANEIYDPDRKLDPEMIQLLGSIAVYKSKINLEEAYKDIQEQIELIKKSSTTTELTDAIKIRDNIYKQLSRPKTDDILGLLNYYNVKLKKEYNETEMDSIYNYIHFIDLYSNLIDQLDQNNDITETLKDYSNQFVLFYLAYFDDSLDQLFEKDYFHLVKSKYLNVEIEINSGSNRNYLKQVINSVSIQSIYELLKDHKALLDIYVIDDENIKFIISDSNHTAIYTSKQEVKDALENYQFVYILADGDYHNYNFENLITCNFMQITSIYSLFKYDPIFLFTAANYGNRFIGYGKLIATNVENKVFHEIFPNCVSFIDHQFNKQNLINTVSPKVLHISTHGEYKKEQQGKNKRNYLVLSNYNNSFLKDQYRLYLSDVESMNLHQTELVFLNACHSGSGDSILGEGVSGFRRAFAKAGAKYIISTITAINDIRAVLFSKVFYSDYIKSEDVPSSFYKTKELLKTSEAVKELQSLKPIYDELDPDYLKIVLDECEQHHCICKFDMKTGEYIPEDWSSFILHKC